MKLIYTKADGIIRYILPDTEAVSLSNDKALVADYVVFDLNNGNAAVQLVDDAVAAGLVPGKCRLVNGAPVVIPDPEPAS